MAIQYGTIVSGQSVSSAFELRSSERALAIGISSHAALSWYAAFQPTAGGPWLRYIDLTGTASGAAFVGNGGGWGIVAWPPTTSVRIETSAAVGATTSVCLVEVVRGA